MKKNHFIFRKKVHFGVVVYASILLLAPNGVWGQQQQDVALDEVVVTGTRTAKKSADTPVRTEVISREEIERSHARDAEQALAYTSGVMLKSIHGRTGKEVWLQGIDGNRVLVLIDGERLSASTGSRVDLSQISSSEIERIEIVKGAVSSLYGSSALGGVVNIITRRPKSGYSYELLADIGSYAGKNPPISDLPVRHWRAAFTSNQSNWKVRLSADIRDVAGYQLNGLTRGLRGHDGYKANLDARFEYQPTSETVYHLGLSRYKEDHITPPGFNATIPVSREEVAQRDHVSLGMDWQLSPAESFKWNYYHDDYDSETTSPSIRHAKIDSQAIDTQWDLSLTDEILLSSGLALFAASLQQTVNGMSELNGGEKKDRSSIELFVQVDYFLSENWELVPGLRYQHDSDFGAHVAPKINLLKQNKTQAGGLHNFRIGLGRGYRVPNLKERHFVFDHRVHGYMVLGDAGLQPEESESLQLGWEYLSDDDFRLDINFFKNELKNLITPAFSHTFVDPTYGVIAVSKYSNIQRARTSGLELLAELPVNNNISLTAGWTHLIADNLENGKTLPKSPEQLVRLSLDYRHNKNLQLSLLGSYQSEEFVDKKNMDVSPSWASWDIKLNYALSEHAKFFAGVDNLTDVSRDPDDAHRDLRPMPGRYVYLGWQYKGF